MCAPTYTSCLWDNKLKPVCYMADVCIVQLLIFVSQQQFPAGGRLVLVPQKPLALPFS